MSVAVLEALRNWLADEGLLDGYEVRYNRWTDLDLKEAGDFVVFRFAGPGTNTRIEQRYDVDLLMVSRPVYVPTQNRINEIRKFLSQPAQPTGVVRFSIPALPTGPFEMENGRQLFKLAVFVYDSVDLPA